MNQSRNSAEVKRIFNSLWSNRDYAHTKKLADEYAARHAPMLTRVATAVDIRCCGSLGTRSVRKQIQSLFHFAIGNMKMRVNANSMVPSTSALMVSALVGSGKSLYHKLFEDIITLMREATEVLDKQIYESKKSEEENSDRVESNDFFQMLSGLNEVKSKNNKFKFRQMLRNPGTKEG